MATEKMYDLAFRFKKEKPWKRISEKLHFAVTLPDGKIGYCYLTGSDRKQRSLNVYVGEQAYQSLLSVIMDQSAYTRLQGYELILQMDCYQCSLECKDELPPEYVAEVRDYAKAHNFRLSGANSFPSFIRFLPYRLPLPYEDETGESYICAALKAAVMLSQLLISCAELPEPEKDEMLLLTEKQDRDPDGKSYKVTLVKRPVWNPDYPAPLFRNDIALAKLRKIRKRGVIQCDAIHLPNPIMDQDPPYFAPMMMSVSEDEGTILPIKMLDSDSFSPEDLMNSAVDSFLEAKIYPRCIRVMNQKTYSLLSSFSQKAKIRLELVEDPLDLEELVNAEEDLAHHFMTLAGEEEEDEDEDEDISEEELEQIIYDIMDLLLYGSDEEVLEMPEDFMRELLLLIGDQFPPEVIQRLNRLFPNA